MRKALGIRHIALRVKNFKECLNFYTNILGMKIDWQPDEKNVYLTNGSDNLALHYCDDIHESKKGNLDHFGIMLEKKADVDYWFEHVKSKDIRIFREINDHRDVSRSFYCFDPDDNIVQIIWHPSIS